MLKKHFLNHIGEHRAALAKVIHNAVNLYPCDYANTVEVHSKRSQASLIHDHMIRLARELLSSPDFHLIRARGRNLFSFRDVCLIQFKKLKANLTSSNYPTKQAELFDEAGVVEGLPGMVPSLPLLTAGYIPKPFLQGIEGAFVVHIVGNQPAWVHRLDDDNQNFNPVTSILTPDEPNTRTGRRIHKPQDGGSGLAASA